jgi:hypothetical protein
MKKLFILSVMQAFLFCLGQAQVIIVKNTEQLYNQWCWAGVSKAILDYYGFEKQQCDIAEWVRTTATFHNFGSVNCCLDATKGCNYWNYNYGYLGSIQEILIHFGNLQNVGIARALTLTEISTEIQNNRLFVIRWGWSSGGGHFVVGHGISGNNIYFMNPWYGEGLHIGTYDFMMSGIDNTSTATHTWTHTNKITSNMTSVNETDYKDIFPVSINPNPFSYATTLYSDKVLKDATLTIYNLEGQQVKQIKNISEQTIILYRDNFPAGIYFISIMQDNQILAREKIIITDN